MGSTPEHPLSLIWSSNWKKNLTFKLKLELISSLISYSNKLRSNPTLSGGRAHLCIWQMVRDKRWETVGKEEEKESNGGGKLSVYVIDG